MRFVKVKCQRRWGSASPFSFSQGVIWCFEWFSASFQESMPLLLSLWQSITAYSKKGLAVTFMMKNCPTVADTDVPGEKKATKPLVFLAWGGVELTSGSSQGHRQPKEQLEPSLQRSTCWGCPCFLHTPQPLLESRSRAGPGLVGWNNPWDALLFTCSMGKMAYLCSACRWHPVLDSLVWRLT